MSEVRDKRASIEKGDNFLQSQPSPHCRSAASHAKEPEPRRTPTLEITLIVNGAYFKTSFAAFLALSAPEPPPSFLPLDLLLDDLPLEPFFELPPALSATFLALSM